jgi:hypothetical protein
MDAALFSAVFVFSHNGRWSDTQTSDVGRSFPAMFSFLHLSLCHIFVLLLCFVMQDAPSRASDGQTLFLPAVELGNSRVRPVNLHTFMQINVATIKSVLPP